MNKKLSGTILFFIFSYTFDAEAQTITIINSHPVKDFNMIAESYILWILSITGILILFILIFNLIAYLYHIANCTHNKNNYYKEKLAKTRKRIHWFSKIFIFIFILYVFFDNFTKSLLDFLR